MEWVGRYQLLKRVDSGRSGVVYLVLDSESKREVVLKMIQPGRCDEPAELNRFVETLKSQIQPAAELQHPKVVAVQEIFQEFGLIWALMEFVKGKSLADLLADHDTLTKEKLLRVFRQTAECLDYAHEQKVFHRNLKPSKILVQDNGVVRILGFGLAEMQARAENENGDLFESGLPYLAPEQATGRTADERSDQFALAATVYQALAGEAPGRAGGPKEGASNGSPPPVEVRNTTLSGDTGQVLSRALSPEPADRYANCAEFFSALKNTLEASPEWSIPPPRKEEAEGEGEDPPYEESVLDTEVSPPVQRRFLGILQLQETAEGYRWSIPTATIWGFVAFLLLSLYLGSEIYSRSGRGFGESNGATTLQAASVGAPYQERLVYGDESPPLSLEVSDGALPPGLMLDRSTGTIRGTPENPGLYRWTVQIADSSSAEREQTFVLNVEDRLAIASSAVLPRGTIDSIYSYNLIPVGENWPHRWSVVDGSLPPGLSLETVAGMIHGMPTEVGEFAFTVQVTDSMHASTTTAFRLTIESGLTIIDPEELPAAILDRRYSHDLVAVSGSPPYVWRLTEGSLPRGLRLGENGEIRGSPAQQATSRFTVEVTDAADVTETREFTVRVQSGLTITSASVLPAGMAGQPYVQSLRAGAGRDPYRWAVTRGSLPSGLSLDAERGRIAGTPAEAGNSRFTVAVRDASNNQASQAFTLAVRAPLLITARETLPAATTGASYTAPLTRTGGSPPYRWAITSGAPPPGLSLDSSSGVIAGTPRAAGTFRFNVQVTDAARLAARRGFELTVDRGLSIVNASPLSQAEVQQSYVETLEAAEGRAPYSWNVASGSLPPGLSLDTSGRVSGTPTAEGEYRFTVEVADSAAVQAQRTFSIRVVSALRMPTVSVLPEGNVGRVYSHELTVLGGSPPFIWSVGTGLPEGLSLDPASGVISGRPAVPGHFRFDVRVTSASNVSLTQPSEVTIRPRESGELVWTGSLDADRVLTIQDGRFPSSGSLTGSLPGVPIQLEVEPSGLNLITSPGPENDWKLLVIHAGSQPRTRITVRWSALE